MSKFKTNMIYASVIYVLVYGAAIGYMHFTATDTREYCSEIEVGMSLETLKELAQKKNLITELRLYPEKNEAILFAKKDTDSDATCQAHIVEEKLKKKNFVELFL